ncbi:MAG: ABC transporter substrate-binding protein [Acidimicrobiales bacterium]
MRYVKATLAGLVGATLLVALSGAAPSGATGRLTTCKTSILAHEFARGKLTVATDNPVYTPWFVNNKPANQKGYESAVVYAIAKVLGVAKSNVVWVTEPFDSSYVPGPKKFDFDINEVSYTSDRAKAVSFSESYYDVQQSIVALKTNAIVTSHSPAQLKTYLYGDQVGTTGLSYIYNKIKPTRSPRVYTTLDQAVLALKTGQIDAIVIDTPTGQYMASSQITGSNGKPGIATQVGQFPSVGEHYGLLFQKNSPMLGCVNYALSGLKSSGTLTSLAHKWLGLYTSVPVIQP